MNKLFEPLQKGAISELIIDRITDALVRGELKPGDKIPTEVEFSEKLGVSRNAVREAMKVLIAFGVLEIRRAEGTFVVQDYNPKLMNPLLYGIIFEKRSMEELLEFKLANAHTITWLSIRNATDEDIAKLRQLGEAFVETANRPVLDKEAMYDAAVAFNMQTANMVKNRMVTQMDLLVHKIAVFTRHKAIEASISMGHPEILPNHYMEEVEVIESRDFSKIDQLMEKRMKIWQELLL